MFVVRRITNINRYVSVKRSLRNLSSEPEMDDDEQTYDAYVKNVLKYRTGEKEYSDYESFIKKPHRLQLKGPKEPFVKNLFRGQFDTSVLTYPQVFEGKRLEELERNIELINKYFTENVNPAEIDRTSKIPDEVLKTMKELFLFGQKIPTNYRGLNFTATEYARMMEIIARDTSIALMQYSHEILCAKSILKYGNDVQKDKYLRKLASGEWLATFCLGELDTGMEDIFAINTAAMRVGNEWRLNGKKTWVFNGENADFYVVVARTKISEEEKCLIKDSDTDYFYNNNSLYSVQEGISDKFKTYYSNNVTVFMVEKSFDGITYEKEDTLGIHGLNLCTVNFNETKVPDENVLGKVNGGHEIVVQNPANERYAIGCAAASIIKSLLSDVTKYAIETDLGFLKLHERGTTQTRIANMNIYLYAIESMIYMTCGLKDLHENYDCTIESAIVKVFSSEAAWNCVHESLQLFGVKGYSKNFPYERYMRDTKALLLFDTNNDILRLFIASMGLRYVSDEKSEAIRKSRNPLFYPNYTIKMFWKTRRQSADIVDYNLKLNLFVHPSLKHLSKLLEYCVLRFEYAVHMSLGRHGTQIVVQEMVLNRMANCVISIYAMTAVLSRVSRSYCIGLRNSDFEFQIAETFIKDQHRNMNEILIGLIAGEYINTDSFYETVSKKGVQSFGYACEHPTKDNF